ncbi:unnamed protein product [Adineta ricciae]|uniref:phenylalanine 4-monooxygenase n=1 Tax=Adineta ricciae TaxID=249248 RepID=A0A816H7N8_ADIRI|nr:unnamed protein product [Adineta ricciae]
MYLSRTRKTAPLYLKNENENLIILYRALLFVLPEAVYWFTIEFGLCVENNERKVYGAAILSSFGDLQYILSGKPSVKPFDPFRASIEPHETSTYQPAYFVAESFKDAKEKFQYV